MPMCPTHTYFGTVGIKFGIKNLEGSKNQQGTEEPVDRISKLRANKAMRTTF